MARQETTNENLQSQFAVYFRIKFQLQPNIMNNLAKIVGNSKNPGLCWSKFLRRSAVMRLSQEILFFDMVRPY